MRERARESIENEAIAIEETGAALANHLPYGGVGHEVAAAHVFEGGLHGGRLIAITALAGGSEDVSGGEMAGVETFGQEFGLRAFAYAGRSKENQSPRVIGLGWNDGTLGGRIGRRFSSFFLSLQPLYAIVLEGRVHGY